MVDKRDDEIEEIQASAPPADDDLQNAPEITNVQESLEDLSKNPDTANIANTAKNMIQTGLQANAEKDPAQKDKKKGMLADAMDEFKDAFSVTDEQGKAKIPQNEGEALAQSIYQAMMLIMGPLKMGLGALGVDKKLQDSWNNLTGKLGKDENLFQAGQNFDPLKEFGPAPAPPGTGAAPGGLDPSKEFGSAPTPPTPGVKMDAPKPSPANASVLKDPSELMDSAPKPQSSMLDKGLNALQNVMNTASQIGKQFMQEAKQNAKQSGGPDLVGVLGAAWNSFKTALSASSQLNQRAELSGPEVQPSTKPPVTPGFNKMLQAGASKLRDQFKPKPPKPEGGKKKKGIQNK